MRHKPQYHSPILTCRIENEKDMCVRDCRIFNYIYNYLLSKFKPNLNWIWLFSTLRDKTCFVHQPSSRNQILIFFCPQDFSFPFQFPHFSSTEPDTKEFSVVFSVTDQWGSWELECDSHNYSWNNQVCNSASYFMDDFPKRFFFIYLFATVNYSFGVTLQFRKEAKNIKIYKRCINIICL